MYTALFIPRAEFTERVAAFAAGADAASTFLAFDLPALFAWGFVQGLKVPDLSFDMHAQESGQLVVMVRADQRELSDTNYVYLATPFRVDGRPGNEARCRAFLDAAASLVCLHTGLNFMRDIAFEGEASAADGRISVPSSPLKNPQPAEGPFLAAQNGADIADLATRLKYCPDPKKPRLLLALQLMNTAMRKDHGFFEYWTALEVACDGKRNRIQSRLAAIYGLKNHVEAGEVTRLSVLARWRDRYVHRGERPPLSPDVERYLQLLFLDLLRDQLELPPRRHLATIQQASGFDLTPLGLEDRRPDEWKARDLRRANPESNPEP
ncbi:MAG: hypothetical protein SFV24_02900 [Gemmatimonadales bacterium]|nr:hypothetical protein [Gemmatimonadales bacterium]